MRHIASNLKWIFFILWIAYSIEAFSLDGQKSFQSEFSVQYSKHNILTGTIYYDNMQDNLRVDFDVLDSTYSSGLDTTVVSHYYDLFEKAMFEVSDRKCTKYSFDTPTFPIKIPSDAREVKGVNGAAFGYSAEVSIDNLNKNVEWHINKDGYIMLIKIMSHWGVEATIQLYNTKELSLTLSSPITSMDRISGGQLYCDRITEKFSSQSKSCPRSCSLRGECVDGTCYCFNGFGGKDCSILPSEVPTGICGNGILEEGEECDDGNLINDDCCSRDCKVQRVGHTCISGNSCRMPFGTCSSQGVCESEIDENGYCSDDNECTIDTCVNGECVSEPKEMNCPALAYPLTDCNVYHGCDPKTGNCLYKPKEDGDKCEGSDPCSGYCKNGRCVDSPISCNSDRLCHESYCDATTGGCIFEPLKDGTPCLTMDGCKFVCQTGICMMADSTCPQLPVSRPTELVLVVYPEPRFRMAAAELLNRWEGNSKSKVAIIESEVTAFDEFNDVQKSLQQIRSNDYIRDVGDNFLNQALDRATRLLEDNLEGDVARSVILLHPLSDSDKTVFDERYIELKKKGAEMFIISSTPRIESLRSLFSFLEEKHYITDLQDDEQSISRIIDLISTYQVNKRQAECGNGIIDAGEECDDPSDACCIDCMYLTCPNVGCRGEGTCVSGTCEYASEACEFLNTACTRYICDGDQCIGFNIQDSCDDGNPCTYDDTCLNGVCTGTTLECASLDDECTEGICDPLSGQCEERYLNGTSCADGLCLTGECRPVNPDFPACDPIGPTSGLNGICCYAGSAEEIADCADPRLYPEGCVLLSWCSSGVCQVDLDPSCVA